jgi:YfiH family protein
VNSPFHWHDDHLAIDLPGAQALFTTRRGGCSEGAYASLNLGWLTGDDPARVERNRTELERRLGVRFAYGRQVHGCEVAIADAPSSAPPAEAPEIDGLITQVPGLAPLVLTADCLPVALAGGGAVAMLHAGWRGLAAGILARGVELMRRLSGDPQLNPAAAVGPGAGPCCYEVSEEVHRVFAERGQDLRHGCNLDLPAIAADQLEREGAGPVHLAGMCTICGAPELFFSHRRDRGVTGRQAGIAWCR